MSLDITSTAQIGNFRLSPIASRANVITTYICIFPLRFLSTFLRAILGICRRVWITANDTINTFHTLIIPYERTICN
jgi:hypothetical protein